MRLPWILAHSRALRGMKPKDTYNLVIDNFLFITVYYQALRDCRKYPHSLIAFTRFTERVRGDKMISELSSQGEEYKDRERMKNYRKLDISADNARDKAAGS